jgi:hypothetical protein
MVYYKLDKPIPVDKIIQDITKLIGSQQNLDSKVLVIKCENIINHTGDNPIPKIAHHE